VAHRADIGGRNRPPLTAGGADADRPVRHPSLGGRVRKIANAILARDGGSKWSGQSSAASPSQAVRNACKVYELLRRVAKIANAISTMPRTWGGPTRLAGNGGRGGERQPAERGEFSARRVDIPGRCDFGHGKRSTPRRSVPPRRTGERRRRAAPLPALVGRLRLVPVAECPERRPKGAFGVLLVE
jgi:hypothetical protein